MRICPLHGLFGKPSALFWCEVDKVSVFVTFSGSSLWKAITQNFETCIDVICLLLEYGV